MDIVSAYPPSSAYAPRVPAPGHPLRSRRDGVAYPHRLILWEKVGTNDQPCHWCGRRLRWKAAYLPPLPRPKLWMFVDEDGRNRVDIELTAQRMRVFELNVDHLDGNGRNNDPSNIVPSCRRCNAARRRAGNPILFGRSLKRLFPQAMRLVGSDLEQRDRDREGLPKTSIDMSLAPIPVSITTTGSDGDGRSPPPTDLDVSNNSIEPLSITNRARTHERKNRDELCRERPG